MKSIQQCLYLALFLCLFLVGSSFEVFALNQLLDSDQPGNTGNWAINNRVFQGNNLISCAYVAGTGNPPGSFYGYYTRGGGARTADGYFEQTFLAPVQDVYASMYFDYNRYRVGTPDIYTLTGQILDATSAASPNETGFTVFSETFNNAAYGNGAWINTGWTTPVLITANTNWRARVYFLDRAGGGEAAGAYVDNVMCNISPYGLGGSLNGAGNDITWAASTGAVALHGATPYRIYSSATSGGPYGFVGSSNTNSYTDATPVAGTIVYYVVSDVDINSVESPTSVEYPIFRMTVNDGSGADVDSIVGGDIAMNWVDVAFAKLRYEVALGTTPGGSDIVGWTNAALATSYTFTGLTLTNGSTYYTSVRVVSAAATYNACPSDGFTSVNMNVRDGVGADVDLTASLSDVDMNWDVFSLPVDHYEVALGTTPGASDVVGWTNVNLATSYTFTGQSLTNGSTYYCSVKAFDLSVVEIGIFPTDGFAPVVGVSTTVRDGPGADIDSTLTAGSIALNWDDVVGFPKLRYEAALGTTPGGNDVANWADMGLGTSGVLSGFTLLEGVTYYCSVRIVHALGTLPADSSDGFVYYKFDVRDGLGADIDNSFLPDTIQMNWDVFPLPVLRYDAAVGTTPGGTDIVGWTNMGTSTSASFSGLPLVNGTTYYASVRIIDMGGTPIDTKFSNGCVTTIVVAVTVRDGLGPDISTSYLDDRAECNWDHPSTALIRYEAALGTSPYATNVLSWANVGHTNQTALTGVTLASGTTYFVSIRGINAFGAVGAIGTSNGFVARRDPVFTDTDAQSFFNNARVLDMIDATTTPGSIIPQSFGSSGGNYWRYKVLVTVTEPGVTSRINAPCRIQLAIPGGQMGNIREIRVSDEAGNEIPRFNLNASLTAPDFVFLVNMAQGETKNYWVSWGNPAAADPAYGFTNTATDVSANQWTPYYSRKDADPGAEDPILGGTFSNADDLTVTPPALPWPFYFFGNNTTAWRMNTNGFLCTNNVGGATQYQNRWATFIGNTYFGRCITPMWSDLWPGGGSPIPDGIFQNIYADRVVYTWRANRFGVRDDIYITQAVLYQTSDIALRYSYLSTLGIIGPAGTYDRPENTENTVGISNCDNTRWLRNTPLVIGIGKSPTAFYQCADAFRGNYVVGAIQGAPTGTFVEVAKIESMVFDSRATSPKWDRIEYDCAGDANNQLVISTRSGPTPLPELGGWSAWIPAATVTAPGNTPLTSTDRYIQYRAEFHRNNTGGTPARLDEVRFISGSISVEEVIANTPNGVSQGQDGIPVEVKIKNTYTSPVNLDAVELTFDLGTYNQTLTGPALPASIPSGGVVSFFFTVDVDNASAIGTDTVHASASASVGVLTFTDEDAQIPHEWVVKKKAELVITQVETDPTHVNKGQSGISVRVHISNIGEVPYSFEGATLTFSLGDYTQAVLSPVVGTVIPENSTFIATISVDVLLTSPSGVSVIGGTASGTNTFSGKNTDDLIADITDSWTIQNAAQLVLEEVVASASVYRGQTNTPVFLTVSNPGEAIANWEVSDILSHFTLGTYDSVYSVTGFPIQIPGGLQTTARYGVDISPVSATGTSDVDADISGTDKNTLFPISWSGALVPTTWTILAEKVSTFKDPSFDYPSTSFNRPTAGNVYVYAETENLLPFAEFVVRWFDPSDTEVLTSVPITADASGTITAEFPITPASTYGQWKVQITNPTGSVVACENFFDVVSPADLSILFSMPATVSEGQSFVASLTFVNSGGANIDSGYISSLDYFGPGAANLVSGPNPSVINVIGNGQATATYNFSAISSGNFSASATAYGFDGNSGNFLTSPAVTSNICLIQTPPALVTQSITAVPNTVYLNQKNLSITVVVRNNGEATAVLTAASLTFDIGTYDQSLVSPALPYSLAGGTQVTLTYEISVDPTSATGLSTFYSNVFAYDNNNPASTTYLTGSPPSDSWTIDPVGIILSSNLTYSPQQDDFNRLQTVYIRVYGLAPLSSWYRVRVYNYEVAQAANSPTVPTWQNVSPQLSADADGYVDHLYTVQAAAVIGTWSVVIESDPDTNGNTVGPMLGLQYFRVQNPGNLVSQLFVSPASVFVGENFTVTMTATNTVNLGSTILNASPSTLVAAGGSAGSATLISGPTPASGSVEALTSETFTWTYRADTDTGIAGSYALTPTLAYDTAGNDKNTQASVNSNKSTSNTIIFYNRSVTLSSATLDFGTLDCGETLGIGETSVVNSGNYPLDIIKWITTDMNGPLSNKISKVNLSVSPEPVGTIAPGSKVQASSTFFVPYNQYAGNYIATMSIYNDRNGNDAFDIDEVYDLFNVQVTVPPCKKVFMVEPYVDLEGWQVGQTTVAYKVNGFSGGNLPLDNVKFKQIVGTNTFPITVTPNPGVVAMTGTFNADVSADITVGPIGNYVATWTVWNDFNGDNNVDATEASDTFQVWVQVGTRNFNVAPLLVDAGSTAPSTVVTGFGGTLFNTGTLNLSKLKAEFAPLVNGGNQIASSEISISPALPQPIAGGANVPITFSLFVPAGQVVGLYTGTQRIYHDDNLNGKYDVGEPSTTFDMQVDVLPIAKVQVLTTTVDVGGISPGTSKIVSFSCRNTGNIDLTALYWEKTNLTGPGVINSAQVTFPPTEPFTVAAGAFFNHDIQISVPLGQAQGTYWSSAPDYWLFEDNGTVNTTRDVGEPQSNFRVTCQVGAQAVDIVEASVNSSGDPNSLSSAVTLNAKNTGSLSLSRLKATGTVLIPTIAGPANIPATANVFTPSTIGSVLVGQTKQTSWAVSIPANTPNADFTGTVTIWEDANNNNAIDVGEASDTAVLNLTVNAKRVVNVVQTQVDLGWGAKNTVKSGNFTIENVGNVALTNLGTLSGSILFGANTIPGASITFDLNGVSTLAIGASTVATVTVTIGAVQADGTYTGNQRIYDDYKVPLGAYDVTEESDTFELLLRIGQKSFYETALGNPPVAFGAKNPGAQYSQAFTVFNSSAVPLTTMKWKIINNFDSGTDTFPAGSLQLLPLGTTNIGGAGNRVYTASTTIDAFQYAGNYVATATIWEDDDNDDVIDATEVSATFNLTITVNGVEGVDIYAVGYDFGQIAQGANVDKQIMFRNTGNVPITSFDWVFSPLDKGADQISDAQISHSLTLSISPVNPGVYASTTVNISVLAGIPLGVYGLSGPQTFTVNGSVSDSANFTCEVIAGGAPTYEAEVGTVNQEVATKTFNAAAPMNRYFLSAWMCPGTGTANISFVAYNEFGKAVGTISASIDNTGTLTTFGDPAAIFGATPIIASGVTEIVKFDHPFEKPTDDFYYYRVFVAFDYTYDQNLASSTRLLLGNGSPTGGDPYAVWIDGVKLEQIIDPDQTKPTSYHFRRTIFSPTKKSTVTGERLYYEW